MSTAQQATPTRGEMPQYKLTEDAYLNDRYLKAGETIYWRGRPEWYMEPVNEAAREAKKKAGVAYHDPIQGLTVVGPDLANATAADLERQAETIATEIARRKQRAAQA